MPLPTRFPGQIELRGSDVRVWNGAATVQHRDSIFLNRYRAYDPRVGQYLQPDPAAMEGELFGEHVYAYAAVAPGDVTDPDGRTYCPFWWCNSSFCDLFPSLCPSPPPSPSPSPSSEAGDFETGRSTGSVCSPRPQIPHERCLDYYERCDWMNPRPDCGTCVQICYSEGQWPDWLCRR